MILKMFAEGIIAVNAMKVINLWNYSYIVEEL